MFDLATARYRLTLAADWGVTVSDSLVLTHLAVADRAITPRDLARRLLISSGTVTTMVDRLERAGLVKRSANPDDRRSLLIGLTDKGRRSLLYSGVDFVEALDDSLPATQDGAFADTLRGIAEAIDAVTNAIQAMDK